MSYAEIVTDPHEKITLDAIVHHSETSALVATGDIQIEGGKLRWKTNMTGRLRNTLMSLQSYKDPLGNARNLVKRIDEVSNGD